jgi:hypothetical protein
MKNQIFLFLIIFILTGCRSFDLSMIKTPNSPIQPKLITLDKRLEDLANTSVQTSDEELKLFTQEVETNLIDPFGDKNGYIVLKRTTLKKSQGLIWTIPPLITIGGALVLGAPFQRVGYKMEAEIRIFDKRNKLIGKYSGIGEGKAWVALYWGYNQLDADHMAFSTALQNAFNEIRPKIQADVNRLNESLK